MFMYWWKWFNKEGRTDGAEERKTFRLEVFEKIREEGIQCASRGSGLRLEQTCGIGFDAEGWASPVWWMPLLESWRIRCGQHLKMKRGVRVWKVYGERCEVWGIHFKNELIRGMEENCWTVWGKLKTIGQVWFSSVLCFGPYRNDFS